MNHGASAYRNSLCRCDICRADSTRRHAQENAQRRQRGKCDPASVRHGLGGYRNWKCRCDICTKANSDACAEYRRRRQEDVHDGQSA